MTEDKLFTLSEVVERDIKARQESYAFGFEQGQLDTLKEQELRVKYFLKKIELFPVSFLKHKLTALKKQIKVEINHAFNDSIEDVKKHIKEIKKLLGAGK